MESLQAQVDDKSKKFLKAVQYYGGEATTTDIRQRTGLNHNEVSYRFNKLEDLDLIEVSYADVGAGNRNPPKIAHLTGNARRLIERGLLDDNPNDDEDGTSTGNIEISEEEFLELTREVSRLKKRVDVLTQARSGDDAPEGTNALDDDARERIEDLNERVETLQANINSMSGGTADIGSAPAVRRLDKRVATLENSVDELEDYVYEWTGFAETYFLAIRRVLEDHLDVDMDSHLKQAENDD